MGTAKLTLTEDRLCPGRRFAGPIGPLAPCRIGDIKRATGPNDRKSAGVGRSPSCFRPSPV